MLILFIMENSYLKTKNLAERDFLQIFISVPRTATLTKSIIAHYINNAIPIKRYPLLLESF